MISNPMGRWNGPLIEHTNFHKSPASATTLSSKIVASFPSLITASRLPALYVAADHLLSGTTSFQSTAAQAGSSSLDGASANLHLQRTDLTSNSFIRNANITWRNPTEDMISSLRDITFRTSLQIAADNTSYVNATHTVAFIGEMPKTLYITSYRSMASAVALLLLGIVGVSPTYRGFWELGPQVSLGLLEVTKALNAPLTSTLPGNRPAENMLDEVNGTKVCYGNSGAVVGAQTTMYGREEEVRKIVEARPSDKGMRYI